ncbi:Plasma membrane t-SNARE, putative [Yarrowia lipolytica]|nr:Plasma membrane t-SNARE, putative [Yarrowia lipolytica]
MSNYNYGDAQNPYGDPYGGEGHAPHNPYEQPDAANSYELEAVGANPYGESRDSVLDGPSSTNVAGTQGRGNRALNEPAHPVESSHYERDSTYGVAPQTTDYSAAPPAAQSAPASKPSMVAAAGGGSSSARKPYKGGNDMGAFFEEVDDIKKSLLQYDENIDTIETLHKRSLNEISEEQGSYTQDQIQSLSNESMSLSQSLKDRIKNLQKYSSGDSTKKTQAENLKRQFMSSIQRYQTVEATYRQKYREQAERQYRIVQPEATDAQVKAAIDDAQGEQIFSQALMTSNRRGEAQTALSEVQNRHREIQKIEQTMAELAQLFHDMEILVAEQEAPVQHIDNQTQAVQTDIEQGLGHTNKAVIKARALRKKKWWCLLIVICILGISLGVGLGVGLNNN